MYSLCLIGCIVSWSAAIVTRNHFTNGAYRRRGHIKAAIGIGLRTRRRLISVSPRNIFCLEYVSASRISSIITCNVLHIRKICRFLFCLAWSETVEFNRLPCPNNKIYDDAVFADRFRYHLTMFGMCILIRISRLLSTYIAYEIAI